MSTQQVFFPSLFTLLNIKFLFFSPGVVETSTSLNTSLDMSHLAISEHFSAEMNAWYKGQEHKISNNNSGETSTKSRSTAATLV